MNWAAVKTIIKDYIGYIYMCDFRVGFCGKHMFAFSLIIEGTTGKVFQFIMPLKLIYYKKTLVSLNKNVFLKTAEKKRSIN
jgi:hypothetical protein